MWLGPEPSYIFKQSSKNQGKSPSSSKRAFQILANFVQISAVFVCFSVMTKQKAAKKKITKTKNAKQSDMRLQKQIQNQDSTQKRNRSGPRPRTRDRTETHSFPCFGVQTESFETTEDSPQMGRGVRRLWGLGIVGFQWAKLTHNHAPSVPKNVILTTFWLFMVLLLLQSQSLSLSWQGFVPYAGISYTY